MEVVQIRIHNYVTSLPNLLLQHPCEKLSHSAAKLCPGTAVQSGLCHVLPSGGVGTAENPRVDREGLDPSDNISDLCHPLFG